MTLVLTAVVVLMGASFLGLPDLSTQREVKAEVEINASPEQVWNFLIDFPAYSTWNPYIYPAKGEARSGARLELTLHIGRSPETFQPTVLTARPNEELSWGGRVIGLERVHTFSIEQLGPRRVRLISRELFRGLILPALGGLPDDTQRGLDMMNHALRSAVELQPVPKPAGGHRRGPLEVREASAG